MLLKRIESAFMRRDVTSLASPFVAQRSALAWGLIAASAVCGGAFVMGIFLPQSDQGNAKIITTKSGAMYVEFDGQLHQTTNLASARLIIDSAEVPKSVKDDALGSRPTGLLMGIPSAPNNLARRTDETAQWTVCDKHTEAADLSLTMTDNLTTTLLAGTDSVSPAVTAQPANDAVVVKLANDPKQLWMVYKGMRSNIGVQDMATRSALGLTPDIAAKAIPISPGLFDAIPPAPALTTPYIADRGQVNPALPQLLTGDVIVTSGVDGVRNYHVALTGGVQPVSKLVADLLVNTGSKQISTVDRPKLAGVPLVSVIDTARYPDVAPNFRRPHVLCMSWQRGVKDLRSTTTILTGESLPLTEKNAAAVVSHLKPTGSIVQANATFSTPGKGWFVRVTGATPESHAAEQLIWIEDNGVRHFLGPNGQDLSASRDADGWPVAKALGIGLDPTPIPWPVAKLYPQGSTLARDQALTMHERIPDDLNQKAIPPSNQPTPEPAPAAE